MACNVLRGAAAVTFLWCALQAGTGADAQPVLLDTGESPVVQVGIRSGTIVIDTWDRPNVSVESADDVNVRKVTARFGNEPGAIPMSVPMLSAPVRTPQGDDVTLPPENFVFSTVSPGAHEAVLVTATDAVVATVHIPANTALLVVRSGGASQIEVNNYRSGTIIVHSRAGIVRLNNAGGDAFVQVVNGTIFANNSNFNRIRARTAVRNIAFEHCSAKQIEATSVAGSILYDGGTLQSGLAHFESDRGNVAIGLNGGARIAARSGTVGRIYTAFDSPTNVQQHSGDETVTVSGGGPLVSVASTQGSVYLYDGALAAKKQLSAEWEPIKQSFPAIAKAPQPPAQTQPQTQNKPASSTTTTEKTQTQQQKPAAEPAEGTAPKPAAAPVEAKPPPAPPKTAPKAAAPPPPPPPKIAAPAPAPAPHPAAPKVAVPPPAPHPVVLPKAIGIH
ncbi:MAG TPA: hypothetical protein VN905_09105 [Candidatus Binatia bacterium]|nr:hypothetical protein [Candidatus Binatia bacterium]